VQYGEPTHDFIISAWHLKNGSGVVLSAPAGGALSTEKRQQDLPAQVTEISWKAQVRLCHRYRRMVGRGKTPQKAVIAVARELLAFMWAIGVEVEKQHGTTRQAA
jgi:hypothetical protein